MPVLQEDYTHTRVKAYRRVAAADGLKNETFCLDLRILINLAAEHTDASTLATVLGLSVSDAGDRPY
jgi:hypothetical protein